MRCPILTMAMTTLASGHCLAFVVFYVIFYVFIYDVQYLEYLYTTKYELPGHFDTESTFFKQKKL
jgi:hypothetical protein